MCSSDLCRHTTICSLTSQQLTSDFDLLHSFVCLIVDLDFDRDGVSVVEELKLTPHSFTIKHNISHSTIGLQKYRITKVYKAVEL